MMDSPLHNVKWTCYQFNPYGKSEEDSPYARIEARWQCADKVLHLSHVIRMGDEVSMWYAMEQMSLAMARRVGYEFRRMGR